MGLEFVCVLYCELCGSMVDVRNPSIFAKKFRLEMASGKTSGLIVVRPSHDNQAA